MSRKKQRELPGTEQPRIDAIEEAADNFHGAKVEAKKFADEAKDLKEKLADLMKEHEIEHYETADGVIVMATVTRGCKTKRRPKVQDMPNQVEPEAEAA